MANFLTYYKKHNPNLYSLMVSLLLSLWYNGISGLLNHYWPNRTLVISAIFLIIPIIIFLTDDGQLNELYVPPSINYPINNNNPAIINGSLFVNQIVGKNEKFKN